jgi:hypothetical protein
VSLVKNACVSESQILHKIVVMRLPAYLSQDAVLTHRDVCMRRSVAAAVSTGSVMKMGTVRIAIGDRL